LAVTATMNISGGHINPAVTIGMLVTRRIKPLDAIAYIIS
jgi:glycerol uptake facilitator-like aquaporin